MRCSVKACSHVTVLHRKCLLPHAPPLLQDKANLERQLKQLNSKSTLLEKNLEKKDAQVWLHMGRGARR